MVTTQQHHNKDHLALVVEFMRAMNQDVAQGFTDLQGLKLGYSLITEEFAELGYALCEMLEDRENYTKKEDFVKELTDLLYVVNWFAARVGLDINQAFIAVHTSNMSKCGKDGKITKREDGKVLKGENYVPPNLKDIVKSVPITL